MAVNTHQLTTLVGEGMVAAMTAEGKVLNTLSTRYKKDFVQQKYKHGRSLNVARAPQLSVTQSDTATVQDITTDGLSVTLLPYNAAISLSAAEEMYDLNSESGMLELGRDMGRRLLREAERVALQTIARYASHYENLPGTFAGSMRQFNRLAAKLDDSLAPSGSRYCAMAPMQEVELIDIMKALPNPGSEVSNQFLRRKLKMFGDVNYYSTPSVYRATLGSATNSTPLTVGTISDGATTLSIDGLSAATATIKQATKFTLGVIGTSTAVHDVDPETKATLPYLKEFSCINDETGATSAITSLDISEPIYGPGHPLQNVSQLPPNDCEVTLALGTASSGGTCAQSVMYCKDAVEMLAFALPASHGPKVHTFAEFNGLPIRTGVGAWDLVNNQQAIRVDTDFAFLVTRPNHCGVMLGA
jgi:hypothetical protein